MGVRVMRASASGGRVVWAGVPSSFQRNWVMEVTGGRVPVVVSSARRVMRAGQAAAGAGRRGGTGGGGGVPVVVSSARRVMRAVQAASGSGRLVMTGVMAVRWRLPSRVVSWRARVVAARVRGAGIWAGGRGGGGGGGG